MSKETRKKQSFFVHEKIPKEFLVSQKNQRFFSGSQKPKVLGKTPEQVYDELATQGLYEEANIDKDEIEKVKRLAIEDYEFGKSLRKIENSNWRIIFNINYDVLRELCGQLMRSKNRK